MKADAALPLGSPSHEYTGAQLTGRPSLVQSRVSDYLQLTRPRLALLVLVTVGAGWIVAADEETHASSLVHALVGTTMLFAGASALNQLLERRRDARMPRTANRPLPAGRLQPSEVLALGTFLSAGGLTYLLAFCQPLVAVLGAFALFIYVVVYTPLKERTPLSTLVGAVPGAVPPLIGWAAARGSLSREALALSLIVFLWQVPHFLAIAWIYRDQYARAGFRVLPVLDPQGEQTGRQMILYTVALIFASLMPSVLGIGGWLSEISAVTLGAFFLYSALAFARDRTTHQARLVLRMSLIFLPAQFLYLVLDVISKRMIEY
jgi:protoheme IX farnesyltransferase